MNSPASDPPMINAEAAAKALCELFLANADRGDNAANDHLIAEMVDRIRTRKRDVDSTPSTVITDPINSDDTCPGCETAHGVQPQPAPPTVQAWTCTACGLHWCTTVVNPTLHVALSVVSLLPTPQQRTAALLAVLRTEVTQRTPAREHTMTETVCFPLDQVVQFDAMATVDTTLWWCRICGQEATATTTPQATSDAITHLGSDHGGVRDRASERKRTP